MLRKKGFKKVRSSANSHPKGRWHRRIGARIRRHAVSLLLIIASLVVSVGYIVWYNDIVSNRINAEKEAHDNSISAMNNQLEAIKERKAAEELARRLAAAAQTAEQAKMITSLDQVSNINSASCSVSDSHNNPAFIDVVVNKKNCLQPIDYYPDDLVASYGAVLSAKAVDMFNMMYSAAAEAGQPFSVTSSYRSYENQINTYQYWVSVSGYEGADTYSARPGYSEHQTGLVIDVAAGGCALDCFGSTSQYEWLQANAADYGFIQRYYAGYERITGYKAEEWHYRYVGTTVAKDMQEKRIKTLEEYWGISGGGY